MLVSPDTTIRVASSEAVTLSLDADEMPYQVALAPRTGDGASLVLEDGEFTFPAFGAPDLVAVEWQDEDGETLFTSSVEVVSRHYFRLSELIGYGDGQDDFGSLPEKSLWMARQAATEVIENNARRSFVRRYGRTPDYGHAFYLRHSDVYELLTDGYELLSDCQVRYTGDPDERPSLIEYLYGFGAVPQQVSRAALELAAYMLRPTNRPIGATGESTDAGYIHFTTAGRDGATDIPEVNAAIEQFGRGPHLIW